MCIIHIKYEVAYVVYITNFLIYWIKYDDYILLEIEFGIFLPISGPFVNSVANSVAEYSIAVTSHHLFKL